MHISLPQALNPNQKPLPTLFTHTIKYRVDESVPRNPAGPSFVFRFKFARQLRLITPETSFISWLCIPNGVEELSLEIPRAEFTAELFRRLVTDHTAVASDIVDAVLEDLSPRVLDMVRKCRYANDPMVSFRVNVDIYTPHVCADHVDEIFGPSTESLRPPTKDVCMGKNVKLES